MDFVTAYVWVICTADSHEYGRKRSWGLYTETQMAAAYMGIALGFNGLLQDDGKSGQYDHYHSGNEDRIFRENMMNYYFYDPYEGRIEDRDICGASYRNLIMTCCQYSTTLSLLFPELPWPTQGRDELSPFEINVPNTISEVEISCQLYCYKHPSEMKDLYRKGAGYLKFYRVCPELCEKLLAFSDSIFGWITDEEHCNPENPTFYRNDGSVFFSSIIHEGECTLSPREEEDVSLILQNAHWTTKRRFF